MLRFYTLVLPMHTEVTTEAAENQAKLRYLSIHAS